MKIAIGTLNKAKIAAVEVAYKQSVTNETLEFLSVDAPSHVSEQPFSEEETRQGAINRAKHALNETNAHVGIGLEGGVKWIGDTLYLCNWVALVTSEKTFTAAGAQIPLPLSIAQQLLGGRELGPVMNEYVSQLDVRQNAGAIGIFTDGLINRSEMFEHTVRLAIGQLLFSEKQ